MSGPYLRRAFHLDQGFDLYDDEPASVKSADAHGDITNPLMEAKLADFFRSGPEEPFFLFAYLWDIHYDYIPPPPFDTLFVTPGMEPFDVTTFRSNPEIHDGMDPDKLAYLVSQYDGEIRATDEMLGRLFERIREAGLWEKSAIMIVADHGEEFFEHGHKGHKHNLHVESVRVPLFVKPAGESAGRVDKRLAGFVDLLPTMLDLCGLPVGEGLPGRSLLAPPPAEDAPAVRFLELVRFYRPREGAEEPFSEPDFHSWAARKGDYKYMRLARRRGERLYFLPDDPGEKRDLSAERPEKTVELRAEVEGWREEMRETAGRYGGGGKAELSLQEEERLRALGYID